MNFYSLFLLVTFIPDFLNIDNTLIKNGYWVCKILLAWWVLFKEQRTAFHFNGEQKFFLFVCFIYALNIYIDVFLAPLPKVLSHTTGSMDFIIFCVGILLTLTFRYDGTFDSDRSFRFFWISLSIALILAFHFARLTPRLLLFDESSLRYDANSTVNTINYGQAGCALCLISIYGFIFQKKRFLKFLCFATMLLGFLSIAKAGSRSPVVVFACVVIFYFIARLGKFKGILVFSMAALLVFLFLNQILELLKLMGSNIGDRLVNIVAEQDTSGRDAIWSNVVDIIKNSPVFGAYYLVPSGIGVGMYPHNFYLEAFMTTGVIGGIPFMILVFITVAKSYKLLKIEHQTSWIVLLYLQILVFGFFSTSLYSSQDCWILMFFILTIKTPSNFINGKQMING
ncbi:MAG: O-antigen ligase family protein [Ginsengibacter sp.]